MNRLWIGVTILALLLAMGIGLLWGSEVFFNQFAENLEQAQSFAMTGNWAAAGEKRKKAAASGKHTTVFGRLLPTMNR